MIDTIYLVDSNGNHIIPVDNNACIGREHLQNCEDKRISRKHAIFTIQSEKISITATHTNPLFYRTQSDSSIKSLLKSAIVELDENDEIGFLPDKFWFKISFTKLNDVDNNPTANSETQELDLNENIAEPEETPTVPMIRIKNADEINKLSSEVEGNSSGGQKSKRPSWMLDKNYTVETSSPKKQRTTTSTAVPENDSEEETISVRDIPDSVSANLDLNNSQPLVDANDISVNADVSASNNDVNDVDSKDNIKKEDLPCSSASPDGNDVASSSSPVTVSSPPQIPKIPIKKEVKVEPADSSSTRVSCNFGIKCYRRNPAHLSEVAHPGDSDYKRPNFPPAPLSAPDCPYGNACYRRNPVHFQQFKHPPSTNPKRNRQKFRNKKKDSGDSQLSATGILTSKRERKKIFLNLDYGLSDDEESDPFDDSDDDTEFVPSDDDTDDDLPDTQDTQNDD